MHRGKRKRNIIIFSLIGVLLCMVVGYAAFQTNLEIKGTSKVTSNWDIEITNVTDGTPTGSAENATAPDWDKLTASMEANLYDKGDAMEYDVTIENKGTIDAKLNDILTNLKNSNSDAVIITFSGYTKGEVLKAKESKIVHVKIEYNPEYEGEETSSEVIIDFEYTQNNNSEDVPKTYLLTYDYRTNGGERVDSEGEYLTSGSNASLSNIAYKQGWRFVGWNTDKDAKVGLTSYQMKEEATTLYAIYSKDIKATYEKGGNVESIGKEEDACTIYNNETSCEITLPTITPSEGYVVDGWYNGNNKVGDPNDKYNLTADITISSKATQNTYTVTYDYKTNGGTSSTKETEKVNYGENIDLTPTASKSGWTFVGWNTNKDATSGLTSLKMSTNNVTLYAIYRKEAKTITITFNKNGAVSQTPNGGSANSANTLTQSCTIAAVYNNMTQASSCNITSPTINASSNTPTVVGYNTSSSATSSSFNQNTSKAVSANATYYAITRKDAKTITVTFEKNGASSISDTTKSCTIAATYNGAAQGTTCNITSPTITATSGFTVLGWNTTAGSTSSGWTQNTSKSFSSNSTYYAVTRSSNQYTASFKANGATIGSTSQSCYRYNGASSCNITTPSITRSGFTITGWGTSASATAATVKASSTLSLSSNATYYAITSKVVTVTYNKGSNVSSIGSTSGTCTIRNSATNCQVTLPSITASSTYIADGWYSGSTKVGSAGSKYTVSNNTTLTAQSKADNITLSMSTTNTTNSITVVANAQADSGIVKYEFSKDGGKTWQTGTSSSYAYTGLTQGTSYNIQVRVTSNSGKTATSSKTVTTASLAKPTFSETIDGEVVVTYPSGCSNGKTCSYVQNDGNSINVTGATTVNVGEDGTIVATVTDGINTVSSSYSVIRYNLYVSSSGSDTTGYGTRSKPYATLTKAYDSATSTKEATIYLMNNVTQNSTTQMDDNKDIVLTSYSTTNSINSLIRSGSLTSYMINQTNGKLTLENVTIDGNNVAALRAAITVNSGADLEINLDATIQNCNNTSTEDIIETRGGGLNVSNGSEVIISSGSFKNNKSLSDAGGGAIYVDESNLIINDGTFTNNSAPRGGAVRTMDGLFTVEDGQFTSNEAFQNGGALYVGSLDSQITINGGLFENNIADVASGIYVNNRTKQFNLNGGTITNNTARYGSGLYINVDTEENYYPIVVINAGTVDNNIATENDLYSDIFAGNGSTFIQSDINSNFVIRDQGYYINNPNSNKVIDVKDGTAANSTTLQLYTKNNSVAQQWKLRPAKIINGVIYYNLESAVANQTYYMDINGNPPDIVAGDQAEIYTFLKKDDFYWYLEKSDDNYYYIKSKYQNMCLEVKGGHTDNKTPIQVYTCNQTAAQKWRFITS